MALRRGTTGVDTLTGTASSDLILGLEGNDVLAGRDGDDIVFGATGGDELSGGNGHDYLVGGNDFAADLLNGDAGNDLIVAQDNDIVNGGEGFDTLVLNIPVIAGTSATLALDFSTVHLGTPSAFGFGSATAALIERVEVSGDIGYGSVIIGTRGSDLFAGIDVDNIGLGAALTINGGGGSDLLSGSSLDDALIGSSGDDILAGGEGKDRLTGGQGEDIFMLEDEGLDFDRIMDFTSGSDALLVDHIDPESGFPFQFFDLDTANPLVAASDPVRTSPGGQFLYDTDTGRLTYDNGSGTDLVAILRGTPALSQDDFLIAAL